VVVNGKKNTLACLFYRDADLVVMDEPSALDAFSESQLTIHFCVWGKEK
jgi:ATP-binding cassette subfamily B protein